MIRFRGLSLETSRYVYGLLSRTEGSCGEQLVIVDDDFKTHYVVQSSIGRGSGMTDDYLREIFEGDIIRVKSFDGDEITTRFSVVQYESGAFVYSPSDRGKIPLWFVKEETDDDIQIIGNIHEEKFEKVVQSYLAYKLKQAEIQIEYLKDRVNKYSDKIYAEERIHNE